MLLSLSCLLYYLQKLLAVASEIQLMLRAARDRKNRRAVVISRRQHLLPAAGLTIGSLVFLLSIVHDLLGVFIDSDVSMRTRVQRIASRCVISLRQLRIAFGDKCQAPCSSRSPLRLFSVGWNTVTACWLRSDFRDMTYITKRYQSVQNAGLCLESAAQNTLPTPHMSSLASRVQSRRSGIQSSSRQLT